MMEGNVRRLPSWMVGATGSADGGRNNANSADKLATTRLNKEKKDNKLHKQYVGLEERPISKGRAKGRKRKENLRDVDDGFGNGDNDADDDGILRKKKKKQDRLQKGVVRKPSTKGFAGGGSGSGEHIQMEENEDAELTVEDLVSIAKEYVKADRDAKKEQSMDREHESQREVTVTHSSLKISEVSLRVPDNEQEKTASYCSAETSTSTSEQSLLSTMRTGDPALDILDLFLGPLLKKPVEEEKKTEFILENLDFAHDSIRQSQKDTREEIVPPVKKKSSLKDRVSSFLD